MHISIIKFIGICLVVSSRKPICRDYSLLNVKKSLGLILQFNIIKIPVPSLLLILQLLPFWHYHPSRLQKGCHIFQHEIVKLQHSKNKETKNVRRLGTVCYRNIKTFSWSHVCISSEIKKKKKKSLQV